MEQRKRLDADRLAFAPPVRGQLLVVGPPWIAIVRASQRGFMVPGQVPALPFQPRRAGDALENAVPHRAIGRIDQQRAAAAKEEIGPREQIRVAGVRFALIFRM